MILAAAMLVGGADLPSQVGRIQPDGRILIVLGEEVTLELNDRLMPRIVSIRSTVGESVRSMPPIRNDGRIRFVLGETAARGRVLKVENGSSQTFDYGAVIGVRRGEGVGLKTTSTCTVQRGLYGLEEWSEPLDMALLGPFKTHASMDFTCAEHSALPDGGAAGD